ncbi:hypothetical protein [Govanella unica]|uniref:PEGA domain-containing protein n=1 Tax=Govanella unica TaxID=2975056 RepID=A0A9X3TWZ5_9PROT|nr:hypothetical protein [Govania unica]MDA5193301.1 hypothetical protein [Govania unica]
MRKITLCLGVGLMLTLAACSTPKTATRLVDARPTISLANVPGGADVMVDGQFMARSDDLFKNKPLKLESGTHKIELVSAGRILFSKTVFLADGTHTVVTP